MTDADSRIALRPAEQEDEAFLLRVRNNPEIVALSSSQRFVEPEEHAEWFRETIRRDDCLLLFVELEGHTEPIGYVRLDVEGTADARISVVILGPWRGRSIGTRVIRNAVDRAFRVWPAVVRVLAYVRNDNEASKRSFAKAGFRPARDAGVKPDHTLLEASRP